MFNLVLSEVEIISLASLVVSEVKIYSRDTILPPIVTLSFLLNSMSFISFKNFIIKVLESFFHFPADLVLSNSSDKCTIEMYSVGH